MTIDTNISIANILQIFISLITLCLAFKISKKLLPDELKKRQLESVLDLIKELNNFSFSIEINRINKNMSGSSFGLNNMNLFVFSRYIEGLTTPGIMEAEVIFKDCSQLFNASKYLSNPLLPAQIANQIEAIFNKGMINFDYSDIENEELYVVIIDAYNDIQYNGQGNLFRASSLCFSHLKELIIEVDKLNFILKKWCDKNNLKNLNFKNN